ncbi:MAG: alpha/beta fold hydrolase [Cyanobacteria bacterium HKST-UBA03]|nr:alpha/beta fold hydrolase [Cyanobacteria bacterium HKST-UBA03]
MATFLLAASLVVLIPGCGKPGASKSDLTVLEGPDAFPFDVQAWMKEATVQDLPLTAHYRNIRATTKDGVSLSGTLYIPNIPPTKDVRVAEGVDIPHTPAQPAKTKTNTKVTSGATPNSAKPGKTVPATPTTKTKPDAPSQSAKPADKKQAAQVNTPGKNTANGKALPSASTPKKYPLIILTHGLSGSQWDWGTLPKHLMDNGYAVLAYDLRGHGSSTDRAHQLYTWRNFDTSDWEFLIDDFSTLIDHIAHNPDLAPWVNTDRVGLIGADIGANAAFHQALANKPIQFIVALSPGLEYAGFSPFDAAEEIKQPVLYTVTKGDVYALESTQEIYDYTFSRRKLNVYGGSSHGTAMLTDDPKVMTDVVAWIQKVMPVKGKGLADTVAERPKEFFDPPSKKEPGSRGGKKKRKATDIPMPEVAATDKTNQPQQPNSTASTPTADTTPKATAVSIPQPSPQPTPQPGPLPQPVQPQPHPTAHNNQSPFRYDPVIKSTVPNANYRPPIPTPPQARGNAPVPPAPRSSYPSPPLPGNQ